MAGAGGTRRTSGGMPPEDWDLLLQALAERLRSAVAGTADASLRDTVEGSVHDLELLQAALAQERGYVRRIEAQLQETCAALATALAGERSSAHRPAHDGLGASPQHNQPSGR